MAEKIARRWLMEAIVSKKLYGRALCPFAASVVNSKKLRMNICDSTHEDILMTTVEKELTLLCPDKTEHTIDKPETTLIVVPHLFHNNYRSMIHFSWKIMDYISSSEHYREKMQVVNFHPNGMHSLFSEIDCPSDYTIRSPYPIFHLLREEDILKAVNSSYPQPEEIPSRNSMMLQDLGIDECRKRFDSLSNDK